MDGTREYPCAWPHLASAYVSGILAVVPAEEAQEASLLTSPLCSLPPSCSCKGVHAKISPFQKPIIETGGQNSSSEL